METRTANIDFLDKQCAGKENAFRIGGKRLREELEAKGGIDRYEKMQPPKPNIDDTLINSQVEQYWPYNKENGDIVGMWYKGVVECTFNGMQTISVRVTQKSQRKNCFQQSVISMYRRGLADELGLPLICCSPFIEQLYWCLM